MKKFSLLIALTLLIIATASQAAEVAAGKVGYMSGTLVAQRADGTIKVMGPKSEVLAGDMLITAKDSYAQVQMNDGAQMTLRPNSNLKIEDYQFNKEEPKSDNAVFRLLKGGFRTLTGLIGKRGNADAYQVRTASATIGIRGTDFTSRLCATKDCRDDESTTDKQVVKPQETQLLVIGRVMLIEGELSAKDGVGKSRKLLLGAPVYEGDMLITGSKTRAVVAFRDESRITLQENTQFHVEQLKYDNAKSVESAVLKLIKGGVRVFTGLIGRVNHDSYQFKVANATIGIRGTGFDAWCHGPCASGATNPGATQNRPLDGAGVFVWAGEVALVSDCDKKDAGSACPEQLVSLNQAAIIARETGKPVPLIVIPPAITDNSIPRPDSIPVDMEKLFGTESNAGEPGLYVTVHDGHVVLAQADKSLDLGRGETGFSSTTALIRLPAPPAFMVRDIQQINQQGENTGSPNPSLNPSGCVVQ